MSGCEINNSTNFTKSILIDTQLEKHDIKSIDYQLENERYNIFIQYPELQCYFLGSNLEKINEMIKNEALKKAVEYEQDADDEYDLGHVTLEINYEIKYFSESYISITFKRDFTARRAAHPTSLFYTLNIDLKKAKHIKLGDMANVDEYFVRCFRKAIKDRQKTNPYPAAYDYFTDISDKRILEYLKSSDCLKNHCETFSYFTYNQICIVYTVPHSIGDYTIVEIDMKSLDEIKE